MRIPVALLTLALMTSALPTHAVPRNALADKRIGLYAGSDFRLTTGRCSDCPAPAQALWYFADDTVAVPLTGAAGFVATLPAQDDVRQWAYANEWQPDAQKPALIWLGSPLIAHDARLDADGRALSFADGARSGFALVSRLPSNVSWFNADSTAWLQGQRLALRGVQSDGTFTARTIWPSTFDIDLAALAPQPLKDGETLATLVRADDGGARLPASARLLWERTPGAARAAAGKPVLAIMLNGAQGDDDEAHGGHFALATGILGARGEWNDWLVANFYNLDIHSEKGIVASMLPMDAYLTDLNAGQGWYRPSWMVVAVLRDERGARLVDQGLARVFNHFYRHDFSYRHATANCAGISLDTLRSLGWALPVLGPTSKAKAWLGLPWMAMRELSVDSGLQAYEYMMAERSGLFPFVAFNLAGSDLLGRLTAGKVNDSGLERTLADDVEAVIFVRVPQIPSSRAFGREPVASYDEYMARVPADRSRWIVRPAPPRPFPDELRDPGAPKEPLPASRRALIVWLMGAVAVLGFIAHRLLRR
ncbi:hypothetical protein [Methyloversatilis thermotolerans]|uniref:hypothetical protein n=1 Tax=Methyloversatilis thermotolerans TaxID=1346290 RepID=UPI001E511E96|nr:hypothetical protein [Methyloversatilis thermotolerans]